VPFARAIIPMMMVTAGALVFMPARGKANLRCTVGCFENCGPPRSDRPETRKGPSCSEIEVIIRGFESGPGVFADDGAFASGSRRDIELGARNLYDHCVGWGIMMMPHTAGKTIAMYFALGSRSG
jgi:hypothetical protein